MNKKVIETALVDALRLLNSEVESVVFDTLKEEYLAVISKIEAALLEI
jgi:hypothetical protein